jgi:hypothetical protein
MLRTAASLAAVSLLVAACGGDGGDPVSSAKPKADACPEGTAPVRATDVIAEPPPGYEVFEIDRKVFNGFVQPFKTAIGDGWRGYDAKILAPRRNSALGAAVMVINTTEAGSSDEVIAGAEEGAEERNQAIESITIGGQEGRIVQAPDGAYIAARATGDCSVLLLIADTESRIRRVTSAIRSG